MVVSGFWKILAIPRFNKLAMWFQSFRNGEHFLFGNIFVQQWHLFTSSGSFILVILCFTLSPMISSFGQNEELSHFTLLLVIILVLFLLMLFLEDFLVWVVFCTIENNFCKGEISFFFSSYTPPRNKTKNWREINWDHTK